MKERASERKQGSEEREIKRARDIQTHDTERQKDRAREGASERENERERGKNQ